MKKECRSEGDDKIKKHSDLSGCFFILLKGRPADISIGTGRPRPPAGRGDLRSRHSDPDCVGDQAPNASEVAVRNIGRASCCSQPSIPKIKYCLNILALLKQISKENLFVRYRPRLRLLSDVLQRRGD
ncbi:hypothetical protein COW77_00375 [Candidatus Wolfebacteria bacterium CG18_big_fil_WC_8_21_14_2_50_39_7]|uniref:Uncharacterized protein n=2 Tax=Candidatus Wolfeibacteriota TaxID=1752735 RepID=A0A2H0ED80_9BACT|nr:MAG: hypothetical protein AUJ30_00430 [Candidatus Wolfebacteria bacterium CG1_02_39_135]PIP92362.1 MAG: hypothetical protein COW77_00375 [Candidatus Wolfebacteria bacterium CG18_big_fil_WC_8_21_14_2_50_39_7]